MAFAVLKTVLIAVMPDATLVPTIVKVAAAIVLVLFALTGKPLQKGFFHRLLFIGLLFFLMADKISPKLVWCHCISTALFYLSLWLICYFLADKGSDNGMTAS